MVLLLLTPVGQREQTELSTKRFISIGNANAGHIRPTNVVAHHARFLIVRSEPIHFDLDKNELGVNENIVHWSRPYFVREATHENRISRQFTHVDRGEFPDLCVKGSFERESDCHQGRLLEWDVHLGEMELHRIIGGQRDAEAALIIFQHRIAVEVEEERIVAQR
jgi:hypothetical protein